MVLNLIFRTANEAIVESLGSELQLHMKIPRNASQKHFEDKFQNYRIIPVVSRANAVLAKSLDGHFGSRESSGKRRSR